MRRDWRKQTALVTGSSGLLGSWLTHHLLQRGATVVALVHDWNNASPLLQGARHPRLTLIKGDVEDEQALHRVFHQYEISDCFHLAAQPLVGLAYDRPTATFRTNIAGTWNILEAARQAKHIQSVIVASSDKAYGAHEHLPYTETMPLLADTPYDVSKACAELLTRSYAKTFKLPVAITRCTNLYGGGDLNFSRIIPGTIKSAFENEAPIIRSDGTYQREYLYVEDAVVGYLKLSHAIASGRLWGEAINFGSNEVISVLDLVALILKTMGKRLRPVIQNTAQAEIRDQYLSSAKAKQELKWQATTKLVPGLKKTVQWYKNHFAAAKKRPRQKRPSVLR